MRLILITYFLSGFAAIGLEVLWTRILILVIGGSAYAFSIVLAVFLSGVVLGSLSGSKLFSRTQNPLFWFAILQIILGILVIFSLPIFGTPKSIVILSAVYLSAGSAVLILSQRKLTVKISFILVLIITLFTGIKFAKWDTSFLSSGLYVEPDIYKGLSKEQIVNKIKKSTLLFGKEGISKSLETGHFYFVLT